MSVNDDEMIARICSKLDDEEKKYFLQAVDENPVGLLVEADINQKTELMKNIRAIGVVREKSTVFDYYKFKDAYAKFVEENKLRFTINEEWKVFLDQSALRPELKKYCENHGPMKSIPKNLGIFDQTVFSRDGSVSPNLETMGILDENASLESARMSFVDNYLSRDAERKAKIANFRFNWKS